MAYKAEFTPLRVLSKKTGQYLDRGCHTSSNKGQIWDSIRGLKIALTRAQNSGIPLALEEYEIEFLTVGSKVPLAATIF